MGYVRLRIRELAEQKGWTFKEVADRSGVNYNTVRSYVQRDALNTADDFCCLQNSPRLRCNYGRFSGDFGRLRVH
jgi:transcriptional regulator with XRE-family HTH domain